MERRPKLRKVGQGIPVQPPQMPVQPPQRPAVQMPIQTQDAPTAAISAPVMPVSRRITPEIVQQAQLTLDKYREGKSALDNRIVENQQWYRLRHWENLRKSSNPNDPQPASAWLLNSIANKHADAMDNYPEPVVLPREQSDEAVSKILGDVLPVVLEQNRFEDAYSEMWWRKLKCGTGCYGVFWNNDKQNGLGDIDVKAVDILNLYWEPGIKDLQKSRNLFCVELVDNDLLERQYPQLKNKLGGIGQEVRQYVHDSHIDTSSKSAVIDWYYKGGGKVHFCKFVNSEVLYASEDDPACAERGFYDHGFYPFVLDTLFPDEDSPAGFGYLDVCKDAQMRIDKLNQVIVKNAVMAGRPRFFIKGDGTINENEFADWEKDFVHYSSGGSPQENIMPIETPNVSGAVLTVLQNSVDELKETSGNRDFSQGGTAAGVTAASAIAALQEAGSKLSRDMIKGSYRAFHQVCTICVELMRQFYTEPRYFRIVGEKGAVHFVSFDNGGMMPQAQGMDFGQEMGMRLPVFDIIVKTQRANPFSTAAQNETAKELYSAGFFNPQLADQALACLEMMTFEGKDKIVERIAQNGTLFQQLQMMQQQMMQMATIIDMQNGSTIAQSMGAEMGIQGAVQPGQTGGGNVRVDPLGQAHKRSARADDAARRARNVTGGDSD